MFGISTVAARIIGIAVLVVGIFGFGYYRGHHAVQVKFDEYKAEVQATAEAQAKQVAIIEARHKQITQETENAYKTKLASLRAYYGMQHPNGSGTMLKVPSATAGFDGYPSYTILVGQCAETTLQLTALQDWVKGQSQAE